jgi:predicted RNase H-like nuclease (RuvC/YqgF family)
MEAADYGSVTGIAAAIVGLGETIKFAVAKLTAKKSEEKAAQMAADVADCATRLRAVGAEVDKLIAERQALATELSAMRMDSVRVSSRVETVASNVDALSARIERMDVKMEQRDEKLRENLADATKAINDVALQMARAGA